MKELQILLWLFPVLFLFHDFEEVVFIQAWIQKNKNHIISRFPRLSARILPHFEKITTFSFAVGVLEELVLILTITVIAFITKWYYLWIGLFIIFTIHLIIHCLQAFLLRAYVPSLVTSIICFPFCFLILWIFLKRLPSGPILKYSIIWAIIIIVNLALIHKIMDILHDIAACKKLKRDKEK